MHISYQLLNNQAVLPSRNHSEDAGIDLHAVSDIDINPLTRVLIKTGLAIEIPEGFYGRIAPRSGLALKYGIDVLAGVVDSSYRGEIGVILFNTDQYKPYSIKAGDRVAQLIIERHYNFPWICRSSLKDTNRSNNGFGSSGI